MASEGNSQEWCQSDTDISEAEMVLASIVQQVVKLVDEEDSEVSESLALQDVDEAPNLVASEKRETSGVEVQTSTLPNYLDEIFEPKDKMVTTAIDAENGNFCIADSLGNYLQPEEPVRCEGEPLEESNDDKPHIPQDVASETSSCEPWVDELDELGFRLDVLNMSKILETENRQLHKQIGNMKRTMAFVMSKYRKSVAFFMEELEFHKKNYAEIAKILKEKAMEPDPEIRKRDALIAEMKQVMKNASLIDDRAINCYEEEIVRLRYENQELRGLLQIGKSFGSVPRQRLVDNATQTTEESSADSSQDLLHDDIFTTDPELFELFANSFDEDGESFYTANSLSDSTPSLTSELLDGDCDLLCSSSEVSILQDKISGDHDKIGLCNTETVINTSVLIE